MNSQNKNSFHLVNIINRIKKDTISDLPQNEELILSLNVPNKNVDSSKLDNPISEIQELGLDALPQANPSIFQQQKDQSITGILEELFQQGEFDGKILQQDNQPDYDFKSQVQEKLDAVSKSRSQYQRIYERKNDGTNNAHNDPDVQKKLQNLKDAEQNFCDFIGQNEEKYFKMAQFNYRQAQQQHDKKNFLPVKIIPSIYKSYFSPNYLGNYDFAGFKKLEYNSQNDQLDCFRENEFEDAYLSKILSGYGLGRNLENELEHSVDETFEDIQLKTEYKRIDFSREWLDTNIFKLKKLQIKNQKQFSWSNGKKIQEKDAKFPYIPIAAIVIRNIEIQGFRNDESKIQFLNKIKGNSKEFHSLFFQLNENSSIAFNPIKISIKKPQILGYILRPFQAFPLSSSLVLPQIQEKSLFKQENQIQDDQNLKKIELQKEKIQPQKQIFENDVYFSSTDNFSNEKEIQVFATKQFIIPQNQQIRVIFINKNSYLDKYFINFENLYHECIQEWIYMMCIDMKIVDKFDQFDMESIQLNVIVDKSGQTFTKGFGEKIICPDSGEEFNQKFGFQEFQLLIQNDKPDQELQHKCKAIIMHEIGRVFGLFREKRY